MSKTWEDFLDCTDRLFPETWELPSDWTDARKHMEFMLKCFREGLSPENSVSLYNKAFAAGFSPAADEIEQ